MPSLKNCSNAPQFVEERYDKPIPPGVYKANNCLLSQDNLPDYIAEGYYKVVVEITKKSDPNFKASLNATSKVEKISLI